MYDMLLVFILFTRFSDRFEVFKALLLSTSLANLN